VLSSHELKARRRHSGQKTRTRFNDISLFTPLPR
jgi:hypothetical protein